MTQVYRPESLGEFWDMREKHSEALIFAGGTDLFVKLRVLGKYPPHLIGLADVREMRSIEEQNGAVFIGANATHARLLSHPQIREHFPSLASALRSLGSPPIRNMGTIGGNICTASPAGDTLPPLYVLGAEVELRKKDGSRRLPIRQFILGPGKTALADGELLTGVWLEKDDSFTIHHFEKVGQRNALAIAIASLAALVKTTETGIIERARFAWGSVGPTVVTSQDAEDALVGLFLDRHTLHSIVPIVERSVCPIDDVRASAAYRRALAGNLVLRLAGQGSDREESKGRSKRAKRA